MFKYGIERYLSVLTIVNIASYAFRLQVLSLPRVDTLRYKNLPTPVPVGHSYKDSAVVDITDKTHPMAMCAVGVVGQATTATATQREALMDGQPGCWRGHHLQLRQ